MLIRFFRVRNHGFNEKTVLNFLQNISSPTCLISADPGFKYDKEKMNKRKQLVKNIEFHELKGGHHIHMEKPEQCATILNNFFAKKA